MRRRQAAAARFNLLIALQKWMAGESSAAPQLAPAGDEVPAHTGDAADAPQDAAAPIEA